MSQTTKLNHPAALVSSMLLLLLLSCILLFSCATKGTDQESNSAASAVSGTEAKTATEPETTQDVTAARPILVYTSADVTPQNNLIIVTPMPAEGLTAGGNYLSESKIERDKATPERTMILSDSRTKHLTYTESRSIKSNLTGEEVRICDLYKDEYGTVYVFDSSSDRVCKVYTSGSAWKEKIQNIHIEKDELDVYKACVLESVKGFFCDWVDASTASLFDHAEVSYNSATYQFTIRIPIKFAGYKTWYKTEISADASGDILSFDCAGLIEMLPYMRIVTAEQIAAVCADASTGLGIPCEYCDGGVIMVSGGSLYLLVDIVEGWDYDSVDTSDGSGIYDHEMQLIEKEYYIRIAETPSTR